MGGTNFYETYDPNIYWDIVLLMIRLGNQFHLVNKKTNH